MLTTGSEASKKEKLQALLEDVRKARTRELADLNEEISKILGEARELRAQLTIKLSAANVPYSKAKQLLGELNQAEKVAGITDNQRITVLGVPGNPPTSEYSPMTMSGYVSDKCVIPHADELKRAYRGSELPAWIQHYADTGELLTNDEVRQLESNEVKQKEKGVIGRLLSR